MRQTHGQGHLARYGYVRRLTVENRGGSQMLRLFVSCDTQGVFAESFPVDEILGRFHGRIRVTADKKTIFSSIRERLDEMERRRGCRLMFEVEDRNGTERGGRVTMTCYVYEPADKALSEFGAFKRE